MHSARELRSSDFRIDIDARRTDLPGLFEGFSEHDRLGLVMSRPCGAVGASALICATVTAFYDIQRSRSDDFFVYPDYFLFHVGRRLGDHAWIDVWPARKEVLVDDDPQAILEAIADRGVTRLLVEDGVPGEPELEAETLASVRARIESCLAYSAAGRVRDADVRISANPVTEGYVEDILAPEAHIEGLRAQGDEAATVGIAAIEARIGEVERAAREDVLGERRALREDGVPLESYRRVELSEALGLLGGTPG